MHRCQRRAQAYFTHKSASSQSHTYVRKRNFSRTRTHSHTTTANPRDQKHFVTSQQHRDEVHSIQDLTRANNSTSPEITIQQVGHNTTLARILYRLQPLHKLPSPRVFHRSGHYSICQDYRHCSSFLISACRVSNCSHSKQTAANTQAATTSNLPSLRLLQHLPAPQALFDLSNSACRVFNCSH